MANTVFVGLEIVTYKPVWKYISILVVECHENLANILFVSYLSSANGLRRSFQR